MLKEKYISQDEYDKLDFLGKDKENRIILDNENYAICESIYSLISTLSNINGI